MVLQPRVIDISHHNTVSDFRATSSAGIWGVIHKATQGTGYRDPNYPQRRQLVSSAGMLWGAYHFGDSSDVASQVSNFLNYAAPGNDTLLALDYEDHPSGKSRTMRPQQMVSFLREIERRTGRKAWLYSGNRIKEDIHALSAEDRAYVAQHPLWLCQYGNQPSLPMGFNHSTLWQYTDGKSGPQPHSIAGVHGLVDLNAFNGTREDLEAAWMPPAAATEQDDFYSPPRGSDDDGGGSDLPPFLQSRTGGTTTSTRRSASYSLETEMLQTKLEKIGYPEVGDIDGKWGGKTRGAVTIFMNDRGRSPDGLMTEDGFTSTEARDVVASEISRAITEHWVRPIARSRADATPKDIAPKVETVKVSLWGRFSAKIAAGLAAMGITANSLSGTFQTVKDALQPVQDTFNSVPGSVWFLMLLMVAGGVWYFTDRAAKAATKDYNTGRLN